MTTKRYIELSLVWVMRNENGSEENTGESRSMGYLRWDADHLELPPVEVSSIDALTVELMRAYVDAHDERHAALRARIAEHKRLSQPADMSHAMAPQDARNA